MNTMPDNAQHNRGRAKNLPDKTFRTPVAILCAGLLLLPGCAAVKGPASGDIGVDRIGRIADLPIANLSNSPAPLAEYGGPYWTNSKATDWMSWRRRTSSG